MFDDCDSSVIILAVGNNLKLENTITNCAPKNDDIKI